MKCQSLFFCKNYFKMLPADFFTQGAKHQSFVSHFIHHLVSRPFFFFFFFVYQRATTHELFWAVFQIFISYQVVALNQQICCKAPDKPAFSTEKY